MIHPSEKYQHIQDPTGKIAKDEPVFLMRCQDVLMIPVMMVWGDLMFEKTGNSGLVEVIQKHSIVALNWQEVNGCKLPD